MSATDRVRSIVAATGPIRFDQLVDVGLYDPDHGFYATTGRAGRRGGDFITSPEVGPLFGAVLARVLDARWDALGRPKHFCVAEAAAGRGTLARSIRLAAPACLAALDYVLVDVSEPQRDQHADLGSPFRSASSLPERADVILANELLDNLAFRVARLTPTASEAVWSEILIDVHPSTGELVEITTVVDSSALPTEAARALADLTSPAPDEAIVEVPLVEAAHAWVIDACARAGLVLVIDYGADTAELGARADRGWLRTYRDNQRGGAPLQALGHQDITIDVPFDQLPPPTRRTAQRDFLDDHGITELVDEGRRIWGERAALGDLQAIRARSRIVESEALLDPAGLGGFVVLEWESESRPLPQ